jgi:PAS domain-containing protein
MSQEAARRVLQVVPAVEHQPPVAFCGHCGARPENPPTTDPQSRVCQDCQLGLLLEAPGDVAPGPGDPFVVINGSLVVCALSKSAEEMLGLPESDAVNRHIGEFLMPADVEARGPDNLVGAILSAAVGDGEPQTVIVRPADEFGVRLWVRIGPCGPPRAAIMVLAAGRD